MCAQIKAKMDSDYVKIMLNSYKVWIPGMFINFALIPNKFQVLFSNGVGVSPELTLDVLNVFIFC